MWTKCLASVPRMQCWSTRAMLGEISARPDAPAPDQHSPVRLAGSGSPPAGPPRPAARAVSGRGPPRRRDDRLDHRPPDPDTAGPSARVYHRIPHATGRADHAARVETRRRERAVERRDVPTGGAHQHFLPAPAASASQAPSTASCRDRRVNTTMVCIPLSPALPQLPRAAPPPGLRPTTRPVSLVSQHRRQRPSSDRQGQSWPPRISPAGPAGSVAVQSPSIRGAGSRRRSSAPDRSPAGRLSEGRVPAGSTPAPGRGGDGRHRPIALG